MRLSDFPPFKVISEAIGIITSREKLKQTATTPLYSNAFYLMLNTAITSLLGFFFWMIVARFYTEAEVGFSSAIISAISLLSLAGLAGLNISLVRFLPHAEKPRELINSCYTLGGLLSLVLAGVFLVGLGFWSPALVFVRQSVIFAAAFIVFTILWTLSTMMDFTFVAERRAGFVLSKNTIFSVLKLFLPLLFVSSFHAFGIVASWGIAIAVALAVSVFLFLPRVQDSCKPVPTLRLNLLKDMWRYSAGNYLANLFMSGLSFILPLMVVNLLAAEQNAYFYVGWLIAGLLFAIPGAISTSLLAEGSHFEDKLKENVARSLKFTFLLLVPTTILLAAAGKWLLLIFGHGYSLNSLPLLRVLCLSSLPLGVNHIYTGILRVTGRIKELIVIWGFIALAVLLSSYLIMPLTGITGIGYAWLGMQLIVAIYILAARKLIPPPTRI